MVPAQALTFGVPFRAIAVFLLSLAGILNAPAAAVFVDLHACDRLGDAPANPVRRRGLLLGLRWPGEDAGFAAHLTKPINIRQLELAIERVLPARSAG